MKNTVAQDLMLGPAKYGFQGHQPGTTSRESTDDETGEAFLLGDEHTAAAVFFDLVEQRDCGLRSGLLLELLDAFLLLFFQSSIILQQGTAVLLKILFLLPIFPLWKKGDREAV